MIFFQDKKLEYKMRIDERVLLGSVMIGFMLDEDPMFAMVTIKMDHSTSYVDRGRSKSRSK